MSITMGMFNPNVHNISSPLDYTYSAINLFPSTKRMRFQERKTIKTEDAGAARFAVDKAAGRRGVARQGNNKMVTMSMSSSSVVADEAEKPVMALELSALVTVRRPLKSNIQHMIRHWFGGNHDHANRGVVLQLVSTETEPESTKPKLSYEAVLDWSKDLKLGSADQKSTYHVKFMVDSKFGMPGAITVSNRYEEEFYLESVNIEGVVHIACNSWVQQADGSSKRIFFSTKAYLPSETPAGLKEPREMELEQLRGDGKGLRTPFDRIYDYDTYNDIGNPDEGVEFSRPILGGHKNPYPRRCRTGRPPTSTDEKIESSINESTAFYVPRDEEFEESKMQALELGKLKGILRHIIPTLTTISGDNKVFKWSSDEIGLFKDTSSPEPLNKVQEFLRFERPKLLCRATSSCLEDDEFGRQAIAGINPLSIERLTVFPPVSKLNPSIHGSQESALKEEHITGHLDGKSVQQALEENKLFVLDYHDIFLPFLDQINAFDDRKAYGTRTILFLTSMGTLKPIAIELSSSATNSVSPSKQVLTPPVDATTNWLWQLGKVHVCSNDACVHQLVHHWLRTHACMEPFIIAAHRQLSVMHPIYKLLSPHMRYTLKINAMARQFLINAGGIIESDFSAGRYSMEISCAAYRDWWRFDLQGLPADLIRRGMAIPDSTQVHGIRLLVEDYPYATDGLLIWSAMETLVRTYVDYYYPDASVVHCDTELQAWYNESINVGHGDLHHASWWPKLSTPDDLISILTTMIWVSSAQHAALNYGQYPYGGYVPNRPPHMRRLLPQEHDPEYAAFIRDPQKYFLSSLPGLFEATKYMAVIDILSTHSPDEVYIGGRKDLSTWSADTVITDAFYRFSMEMKCIEKEIEQRNADLNLRNRCGAGVSPYQLLMPSSEPGITGRGVPNSISI